MTKQYMFSVHLHVLVNFEFWMNLHVTPNTAILLSNGQELLDMAWREHLASLYELCNILV